MKEEIQRMCNEINQNPCIYKSTNEYSCFNNSEIKINLSEFDNGMLSLEYFVNSKEAKMSVNYAYKFFQLKEYFLLFTPTYINGSYSETEFCYTLEKKVSDDVIQQAKIYHKDSEIIIKDYFINISQSNAEAYDIKDFSSINDYKEYNPDFVFIYICFNKSVFDFNFSIKDSILLQNITNSKLNDYICEYNINIELRNTADIIQ